MAMAIGPIGHTALIADSARTGAYQGAISETVKDGDVVVDLGTGTEILAFFACQARAGQKEFTLLRKINNWRQD